MNTPNSSENQAVGSSCASALCSRSVAPRGNIYESAGDFTVLLEVPGADEKSLDLSLHREVLSISAVRKPSSFAAANGSETKYSRQFAVSDRVAADKIEATFQDGMLKIRLPKAAEEQARKIPITVS